MSITLDIFQILSQRVASARSRQKLKRSANTEVCVTPFKIMLTIRLIADVYLQPTHHRIMSEQYYNTIVSTLILCVMCIVYGDFNWSLNLFYDPSLLELGIILYLGFLHLFI